MPANLPPEYFEAEKRYKKATDPRQKAEALEELISTVPKHKGTDKLRADLRRKLSQLREESAKKKRSGKGDLYVVEKQGAAQAALVGLPNSGKSSLLKALTNANPVIADYPISTIEPLAGMMAFEDIQFQLVDLPPLGNESTDGWVSGILRNADLLVVVVDLADSPEIQTEMILDQISEWKIPLKKKGDRKVEDEDVPPKPVIIAANKTDLPGGAKGLEGLMLRYGGAYEITAISVARKEGLEQLRRSLFEIAGVIRAYTKEPGKPADMSKPFVLPSGSNVLDLAELIHREFATNLKYACVWGSSRFAGQRVQKDYVLRDKDVIEYHVK